MNRKDRKEAFGTCCDRTCESITGRFDVKKYLQTRGRQSFLDVRPPVFRVGTAASYSPTTVDTVQSDDRHQVLHRSDLDGDARHVSEEPEGGTLSPRVLKRPDVVSLRLPEVGRIRRRCVREKQTDGSEVVTAESTAVSCPQLLPVPGCTALPASHPSVPVRSISSTHPLPSKLCSFHKETLTFE